MGRAERERRRELRVQNWTNHTRHAWIRAILRNKYRTKFETDPYFQYKIHMWFTYFWVVNMVCAVTVFLAFPGFWASASILYITLVSLYANFATDYGAVSAAEAAQQPTPEHLHGEVQLGDKPPVEIEGDVTITPQSEDEL